MRKLKDQQYMADLNFDKNTKKIKLCCHIFFEYVNSKLRSIIPEYQNANIHDRREGIIFCPECILQKLTDKKIDKILHDCLPDESLLSSIGDPVLTRNFMEYLDKNVQ